MTGRSRSIFGIIRAEEDNAVRLVQREIVEIVRVGILGGLGSGEGELFRRHASVLLK